MYQSLRKSSIISVSVGSLSETLNGENDPALGIMNYDIWGSWSSTVGPNAPLNDSCAPTQDGSAVSAVKAWTSAGFPADQV